MYLKKVFFPQIVCFIIIGIIMVACLIGHITNTLSRHTTAPVTEFIILTEETSYHVGTEKIIVHVKNNGSYNGEIQHPYLEVRRDDGWHILKKNPIDAEPANLLFVHAGETESFEVFLSIYEQPLIPGEYRVVFDFWGSDEYFAFVFEIIDEHQ